MRSMAARLGEWGFLLRYNPALASRRLWARLRCLGPLPGAEGVLDLGGARLRVVFGDDPEMRRMWFGAYELETVELLRRFLRPGDTFIDAGASIGYITAVAASLVGPAGQVHSFEPVPALFARLRETATLNPGLRIETVAAALGRDPGTAAMDVTAAANIGWNTMVPGFMDPADRRERIEVPVVRLDAYLAGRGIRPVRMIKIDTEGYELPVLEGLEGYLDSSGDRPLILCEVAPAAYSHLGRSIEEFDTFVRRHGYAACHPAAPGRPLDVRRLTATANVLLLPEGRRG